MPDDDLLAEQRAFYRARAPEYDEWWQRRGRYDRGEEQALFWEAQVRDVDTALAAFGAHGDVLELAGGTGWWTKRLAATADRLTVVDASPETIDLNREHVGRDDIDYVVADLFDWRPGSHLRRRVLLLLDLPCAAGRGSPSSGIWCVRASGPEGRVFLIDNRDDPYLEIDGFGGKDPYVVQYAPDLHLRRLNDGSEYRVVKVMYEPDELRQLIEAEGCRPRSKATAASSGERSWVRRSALRTRAQCAISSCAARTSSTRSRRRFETSWRAVSMMPTVIRR